MLAAYFCHFCYLQLEYNCALIKVDWLSSCIALTVVGAVLSMGRERGPIHEDVSQILLTNKSKETWTQYITIR
jgi:hypothetical protein